MTKDGLGGAYLKSDGYMGGLFKNPDSQLRAISAPLQPSEQGREVSSTMLLLQSLRVFT